MDEAQIRHLEMIQGVISRLAGNAFLLKGWAITLSIATLAASTQLLGAWLAILGCGGAAAMGALDAYYLCMERRFRALYARAAAESDTALGMEPRRGSLGMYFRAWKSYSVWPLYGTLLFLGVCTASKVR